MADDAIAREVQELKAQIAALDQRARYRVHAPAVVADILQQIEVLRERLRALGVDPDKE